MSEQYRYVAQISLGTPYEVSRKDLKALLKKILSEKGLLKVVIRAIDDD